MTILLENIVLFCCKKSSFGSTNSWNICQPSCYFFGKEIGNKELDFEGTWAMIDAKPGFSVAS